MTLGWYSDLPTKLALRETRAFVRPVGTRPGPV